MITTVSRKSTTFSFIVFAIALFATVFVVWRQNGYPTTGIDDANIFFSYAENLAAGHGFVYGHNPEHVEGFTSMLWMLLCSACFAMHANETGVFILSMLFFIGAQWIAWRLLKNLLGAKRISFRLPFLFYAIAILSSPGYVTWMSITLMDVALWGFFLAWMALVVFESCAITDSSPPSFVFRHIILFALAPLVRPEYMAIVPMGLSLLFLRALVLKRPFRHLLIWLFVFLASLSLLTLFRIHYFGYPFPNTFYAKVSPSISYNLDAGMQYALPFFTGNAFCVFFCVACLVSVAAFFWDFSTRNNSLCEFVKSHFTPDVSLILLTAGLCCLPILTGGDHFAYSRFFQPIYPLICLALTIMIPGSFWECFRTPRAKLLSGIAIVSLLPLAANYATSYFRSHWQQLPATHEFQIAESDIRKGQLYNEVFGNAPRWPNIGVITAGGIARTYAGPISDLMGLNNPTVAHFPGQREGLKNHAAFELAVFPKLHVDVLPISDDISFADKVLKGLFETPDFTFHWHFGHLVNTANGASADLWVNSSFLESLLDTPSYRFKDLKRWDRASWVNTTQEP